MKVSQFDLDNKIIKDLIVIFDNNIYWNFICNKIKKALYICHYIKFFFNVCQCIIKQNKDDLSINHDDKSVCHNMLIAID